MYRSCENLNWWLTIWDFHGNECVFIMIYLYKHIYDGFPKKYTYISISNYWYLYFSLLRMVSLLSKFSALFICVALCNVQALTELRWISRIYLVGYFLTECFKPFINLQLPLATKFETWLYRNFISWNLKIPCHHL